MKKCLLKFMAVILTFVIMSLPVFSNFSAAEVNNKVMVDETKVLEARFLNMLNHCYVYGDDFNDLEKIVNNSIVALLDNRDTENEDYISQNAVNDYLYDMFGFEVADFSDINKEFDAPEGYLYIIPRGYALYEHEPLELIFNEDGTLAFTTEVTIKTHDGGSETLKAETIFAVNADSVFGYNIVVSNLI